MLIVIQVRGQSEHDLSSTRSSFWVAVPRAERGTVIEISILGWLGEWIRNFFASIDRRYQYQQRPTGHDQAKITGSLVSLIICGAC